MATSGKDIYDRFYTLTNGEYYMFFDTTRANYLLSSAYRAVTERMFPNVAAVEGVPEKIKQLRKDGVVIAVASDVVLYSAFTVLPLRFENILCKYVSSGTTYYYPASKGYDVKRSYLDSPDMRYPQWVADIGASTPQIHIYPTGCTEITCDYYASPPDLSTTSTADLGYDVNFNEDLIRTMMAIAAEPNRDEIMLNILNGDKQTITNITKQN